jgi:hypothetical protein
MMGVRRNKKKNTPAISIAIRARLIAHACLALSHEARSRPPITCCIWSCLLLSIVLIASYPACGAASLDAKGS